MRKVVTSFFSIASLFIILTACNQEDTNEKEEDIVIAVETVEAVEGDLVVYKTLYGQTSPSSSTPIMVNQAGEVEQLEKENGDVVKKDDLIAIIKTPIGNQRIKAPKSGKIVNLEVDEGDMITEADPLA